MDREVPKVAGIAISIALSALLIAGFFKSVTWLSELGRDEPLSVSEPVVSAPDPPVPTQPSWPEVIYLEVRAYYSSGPFISPFKHTGIPDQVADKDGVLLNAAQVRQLISAVTTPAEPYLAADCWAPRHAFVFWDPLGRPVAEVDICFECLQVKGGPSDVPDIGALADLTNDLGLPLGEEEIEAFRSRLKRLQEAHKKVTYRFKTEV